MTYTAEYDDETATAARTVIVGVGTVSVDEEESTEETTNDTATTTDSVIE